MSKINLRCKMFKYFVFIFILFFVSPSYAEDNDLRIYELETDIKKLNEDVEELIFQIDDLRILLDKLTLKLDKKFTNNQEGSELDQITKQIEIISILLKDIRNEETITSGEKKIENKEEAIEDVKNKINKDPDLENAAKISIGNSIVQQMRRCWRVNSKKFNTSFEEAQYVIAEAEYNKNGSIIEGSVHIIDTNVPEDSLLISDVLYALYNCRLDLPAEYYYLWEKNKIRFDPDFENKQSEKQINMNLFN